MLDRLKLLSSNNLQHGSLQYGEISEVREAPSVLGDNGIIWSWQGFQRERGSERAWDRVKKTLAIHYVAKLWSNYNNIGTIDTSNAEDKYTININQSEASCAWSEVMIISKVMMH